MALLLIYAWRSARIVFLGNKLTCVGKACEWRGIMWEWLGCIDGLYSCCTLILLRSPRFEYQAHLHEVIVDLSVLEFRLIAK